MTKLWTIFRFEFAYHIGSISTWLYLAVLLLFTLGMGVLITPGDGVIVNNTFHITGITVMGGLIWLVMGAAIAGEAAARDVKTRMHPLTYITPVSKLDYLGGRFLAAFAVNALLILALPIGVLLSFYLPGMGELGPFRVLPYMNVYFLIALPTVFLATALQFSFATLSRQVMTSYLASLLLAIVAQVIAVTVAKLFGNWDLVKLLDPVGVAGIVSSELGTWTPTEKNTRLVTLEGLFLWNRILWLGVAIGVLWLTYLRFNFANPVTKSWWARFKRRSSLQAQTTADTVVFRSRAIAIPQVQRSFGFATGFRQTLRIAWGSFGKIARNPVGLTLVALIAIVSAVFGSRIMTQFGIPLLPTTQQVIAFLTPSVGNIGSQWVVIPLLIIYFVGELVWSERDARVSDLTDATPVPDWVLLTGKFLGLGLIIMVWMALLMAGGIAMQLGLDYDKLEIGLYLKALFGLQLVNYLLFAVLVFLVHVVVNQKAIAHLVMLLVFGFMAFPSTFQVEHSMLIFGKDPGWWYTDMRGFGTTIAPWLWFKAYWIAWALLLAVVARLLWVRGREQSLKYRIQLVKRRFTGSTIGLAIIASVLILTLGSFIFYNTNVLNEYETGSDINERKAEYERSYGRYRNTLQPQLTATKLHVEIYPERQQVEIRAAYTLVNKHTVAIDSIHLGSLSGVAPAEVKFNRPVTAVITDEKLSHNIYKLKEALRPGDSLQLNFVVRYKEEGFQHNGTNALVVRNGTSFSNYDLMPSIGYLRHREINDAVVRKKYGLTARPAVASLEDAVARKKPLSTDQVTFEAIVGTADDEVAVAPGTLQKSWTRSTSSGQARSTGSGQAHSTSSGQAHSAGSGQAHSTGSGQAHSTGSGQAHSTGSGQAGKRRYFHYKTNAPIGGEYSILSAKYAVQKSKWNNPDSSGQAVAIRIYYHPGHAQNIDRILQSVKASLTYFTEQFGPYPYEYFTVIERAGNTGGASADAGMIYYGENYSLMTPDDSPTGFDLPYYILAHEVAHQWWGLARLSPANVEGAGVLIEGLSVYSGMQVLEKEYGAGHLQQYVDYLHASYEMPRSLATPSLIRANESFLYYRKGGLAMYALSKYIGKEKVNRALRSLLEKHESGDLPLPTTLDLYQEIQKVTPDSLNYLLNDLFKKNTYWRLKTKKLAAERTKAGQWEVTMKVQAQKVVVDPTGAEKEVPMNDWLEVGLYEEGKGFDRPLYLQMHRIRSGEQIIKVTVPRRPLSGGIDPNSLMIDVRRDDNMMGVSGG